MSTSFHNIKVKDLVKETKDAISIEFELPEELKSVFEFEAGQYLTLKASVGGEEIRRSYSLCTAPFESRWKVTSKKVKDGKMSNYLYDQISIGDSLEVMPPKGSFKADQKSKPIILFAAGSGITPIMSILKDQLEAGNQIVNLYYGSRSEEDVIFNRELDGISQENGHRFLLQHFYSSNGERLDKERAESIANGLKVLKDQADFFICGPAGMIESTKLGLEAAGVNANQIHIEYFASPDSPKENKQEVVSGNIEEITVIIDEEEHQITLGPTETILEGAERIGIDPPFSCHSGVCTTCKAKVISGEVEMENNFGLGQDEIDEGYVLTCIGRPSCAGVKVSWDEV
jgi:ring-1,2-phenylacetyl-CoA epoxidase subunit PaaE